MANKKLEEQELVDELIKNAKEIVKNNKENVMSWKEIAKFGCSNTRNPDENIAYIDSLKD